MVAGSLLPSAGVWALAPASGEGDGSGCENEGVFAHESLLGASWQETSPQTHVPM